jgi:hypothetical protein
MRPRWNRSRNVWLRHRRILVLRENAGLRGRRRLLGGLDVRKQPGDRRRAGAEWNHALSEPGAHEDVPDTA